MEEKVINFVYETLNKNLENLEGVVMIGLTKNGEIHIEMEEDKTFKITIEEA